MTSPCKHHQLAAECKDCLIERLEERAKRLREALADCYSQASEWYRFKNDAYIQSALAYNPSPKPEQP